MIHIKNNLHDFKRNSVIQLLLKLSIYCPQNSKFVKCSLRDGARTKFIKFIRQELLKKWLETQKNDAKWTVLKYSQKWCHWKGWMLYANFYCIKLKYLYFLQAGMQELARERKECMPITSTCEWKTIWKKQTLFELFCTNKVTSTKGATKNWICYKLGITLKVKKVLRPELLYYIFFKCK